MAKDNKEDKMSTCDALDRKEEHEQAESNKAAGLAGIEKQKSDGKVPIPDMGNVEDAKEWVEENKK